VKSADVSRILRIFYAYISPFVDAPAAIAIPFSSSPCQQNRSVAIVLRFALLWNYYYFFFQNPLYFSLVWKKANEFLPHFGQPQIEEMKHFNDLLPAFSLFRHSSFGSES